MDDLISRKAAIDALERKKDKNAKGDTGGFYNKIIQNDIDALMQLPSAQPEPCNDTISGQTAIDAIAKLLAERCGGNRIWWKPVAEAVVNNLPSAQPDLDEVYAHAETEAEARYHAQIVRCKDCKHQVKEWRTDKRLKDNGYIVCGCDVVGDACGYWALLGQDDDYCSMAERREDE